MQTWGSPTWALPQATGLRERTKQGLRPFWGGKGYTPSLLGRIVPAASLAAACAPPQRACRCAYTQQNQQGGAGDVFPPPIQPIAEAEPLLLSGRVVRSGLQVCRSGLQVVFLAGHPLPARLPCWRASWHLQSRRRSSWPAGGAVVTFNASSEGMIQTLVLLCRWTATRAAKDVAVFLPREVPSQPYAPGVGWGCASRRLSADT